MIKRVLFADTAHPLLAQKLSESGFLCDYFDDLNYQKALEIGKQYLGIVIRSRFKIDQNLLDACSNLKWIARVGAGMENIDVKYAELKGINCLHAPEGNRNAVAEQALGMLLVLMNNLSKADHEVRNGIWLREENRGFEIEGKTVGILGFGNTGSSFAEKLKGFNCKILAHDKYKKEFGNNWVTESSLAAIFEEADIVSLHLPLTAETNYYANVEFFERFKKPIWLINTSRGKVLQTDALIQALETKKVKGAALDVLEFESVSFENVNEMPDSFQKLITMPNVLLSPHIAGWTHESNIKMAQVLFDKIRALKI